MDIKWDAALANSLSRADHLLGTLSREGSTLPNPHLFVRPFITNKYLAVNPYLTAKKVADQLDIAFTTAQRAIGKLEALGYITQFSEGKRDRVYCAKQILDILEEPTKIGDSFGVSDEGL
ncbi:MAG: winged helix-turn-helix transcriptional regulator [Patescibacteria group bacterium]|nr:winged helix-turn-helix transcriptional regulator [Patescibacteria group bacterium]